MKSTQKTTKSNIKTRSRQIKAKLLANYYGNPIRDMKLICVTGATGKAVVAHYLHEILKGAGHHVAVLASDQGIKVGLLHKFLSDAWKAGATHVIVTAPADSLREDVFFGLPIEVAAMTDFVTAGLDEPTAAEFIEDEKTLFDMKPKTVVLNHDDVHYEEFAAEFKGTEQTLSFGVNRGADVRILSSTLYKRGSEVDLAFGANRFTVATFVPGELAVSYMACAAAVATALKIAPEAIVDGIGNYSFE